MKALLALALSLIIVQATTSATTPKRLPYLCG